MRTVTFRDWLDTIMVWFMWASFPPLLILWAAIVVMMATACTHPPAATPALTIPETRCN